MGWIAAFINLGDCDDNNAAVNPNATELCNQLDDDCDGQLDDGLESVIYYPDLDLDGYGDDASDSTSCAVVDGFILVGGDCNDQDSLVNPAQAEICLDNVDNNCNTMIDENTGSTWFLDSDADGFGALGTDSVACDLPVGYVLNTLDCDDTESFINPNGSEICGNQIDEDCSGSDLICDVVGCTDSLACNYNPLALIADGSCYFVGDICDDGNAGTINDQIQNDCVCYGYVPECATNPIVISLDSLQNVTCFGGSNGYINLSVSGGDGPFFASWNSFPIQTTSYANGLSAGVYTFTVEDTQGCVGTFTQEVTQPDGSQPVISGNNDVDPAGNEQYTVNTYPGCTYTWTVSNGLILSGQDNDTLNVLWNDAAMGTIYVYQTDTLTGCQLMDGLAVYINAVGTEEVVAASWKLYPNPASDIINIENVSLNAEVKVLDATGRLMEVFNATESNIRLNVSDFEGGVYFIQVKDDFGWRTERIVKQ
jgi:hypothetical protein